ncbi:hypothetical protein, partial [Ralstonia pseudosolanacearum]|uniref:hypothetical protein n=1 Tax=Ralstonia pseudosolanacearum TaxID=1310165 RepID=UPI003D165834
MAVVGGLAGFGLQHVAVGGGIAGAGGQAVEDFRPGAVGATNRRVDVMGERLDLALRVRFPPLE